MSKTPIAFGDDNGREESYSLGLLWSGLCYLNDIVAGLEQARLDRNPKAKDMMVMSFGSCEDDPMLLNYFFWYSCSAASFLDLFNKTFGAEEGGQPFAALRKFRNKVAGHFSYVQPRTDNAETQRASLRQFATWACGRYSVGREVTGNCATGEKSPSDWGWELTETHKKLDEYIRRNMPPVT